MVHKVFRVHGVFQDSKYQLGFFQRGGREFCATLDGLWVLVAFGSWASAAPQALGLLQGFGILLRWKEFNSILQLLLLRLCVFIFS